MAYLGLHEFQTAVHRPFNWVVADEATRDALTLEADDVYKLALQLDDGSVWALMDDTPTWQQINAGGGGGGGATISTSAYASPPSSPAAGDLWLPSDSFYGLRRAGSWVPWGPLFPMTAPVSGDFTWVNQGGASIDASQGGVYLKVPGGAGSGFRMRDKATPTAPYSITAAIRLNLTPDNTQAAGIYLRNSSSGKLVPFYFAIVSSAYVWAVGHWDAPGTFNASAYSAVPPHVGDTLWFRITDDNTNRICSISTNGQFFNTLYSEGRTSFITPDTMGFTLFNASSSLDSGMLLMSWKEA